jgi:hypothetical protein
LRSRVLARIPAFAMKFERVRRFAFLTVSQIGIRYPQSPLSQTLPGLPAGAPRAGDRFPWLRLRFEANGPIADLFERLDDTRFNLIVIGQPGPDDSLPGIHTHVVGDDPANAAELARARIPAPSFYLLRPDGHVGLAGTRLDPAALARYLAERSIRP